MSSQFSPSCHTHTCERGRDNSSHCLYSQCFYQIATSTRLQRAPDFSKCLITASAWLQSVLDYNQCQITASVWLQPVPDKNHSLITGSARSQPVPEACLQPVLVFPVCYSQPVPVFPVFLIVIVYIFTLGVSAWKNVLILGMFILSWHFGASKKMYS